MIKVLSYNLRDGAKDTYDSLVTFINAEKPDILCLQEANGWNEKAPSRVEAFAQATGFHEWRVGHSNTDFDLITFSRLPIASSQTATSGFWHSALQTVVTWDSMQLSIWNVHLDPRTPQNRIAEVERLIAAIGNNGYTLVAGDLNSISMSDSYPPDLLNKLLARDIEKFGTNQLSFDELTCLTEAGFVDVAVQARTTEPTVPTPANSDDSHAIPLRLDYILTTPELSHLCTNVSVIKSNLTDHISDHYPVVMTLKN